MSSFADSFQRQINDARVSAVQAASSNAWTYPLRGVLYMLTKPSLIRPVLPVLFKGILVSIGIVAALFFFTYLPHVAVLAFVSGPLAFIAAIPLILGEAYFIINYLARSFLFGQLEVDLFDTVLAQRGHQELVKQGRQGPGGRGRVIGNPFAKFSIDNAVRYILTLPLNFIPVVGTACFLGINGHKAGPNYHSRYFQLKGYSKEQKASSVSKRRGGYTAFGVVALLLNLVPVVSILFTCTTAVGAALWAADIEEQKK